MGLTFVPGNETEAGRTVTTVFIILGEDSPHTMPIQVYREKDRAIRSVTNGYKGKEGSYGILKSLDCTLMLLLPNENSALVSEINKRAYSGGIVINPDMHEASKAQKGLNIREGLAGGPVANACNLRVI